VRPLEPALVERPLGVVDEVADPHRTARGGRAATVAQRRQCHDRAMRPEPRPHGGPHARRHPERVQQNQRVLVSHARIVAPE